MFGLRPDGKRVKNLSPIFRVIPNVMLDRSDAQVYFKQDEAWKINLCIGCYPPLIPNYSMYIDHYIRQ